MPCSLVPTRIIYIKRFNLSFYAHYYVHKNIKDNIAYIGICTLLEVAYQTLLCRFEGLGREAVQAEQPGFVIGGTGTETIYQQ